VISIRTRGVDRVADALQAVTHGTEDLRPFWPVVARLWGDWMRRQYASEGGWGGRRWAPLAPATVAEKAAAGFGARGILVRTGEMRNASTAPRRMIAARSLTLVIEDEKAPYHQGGTSRMPARPIIPEPLPASAEDDVERAAEDYIDDLLARWGL